jgi:hypothetical protein
MKQSQLPRGQVLVIASISLFLIFGLMSLAVDLGWDYFQKESAQSAADSAAAAVVKAALTTSPNSQACGSAGVWCGSPAGTTTNCPATAPTSASTSFDNGCMLAGANGFTTSHGWTVSVQANATSPPPTVPGVTVAYWATVRISHTANNFFNFSGVTPTINVISTAGMTTASGSSGSACMYILSPNATNALNLNNNAQVTTQSCGVYVNSNATQAAQAIGSARLTSTSTSIVGGYTANNGGVFSPLPTTGVSTVADPFAGLPAPTIPTSCSSGNFTAWQPTAYTPSAGCYNGFTVANGMNAVLGAGTYVINGGTFSIQGGSTVTATGGVMFYLTNGATINIANGANVTLAAESSGTYQGVLFFQDRTMSSPGSSTFAGGASMHFTGSIYLPNALLNVNNGVSASTMALVVGQVNFAGGSSTMVAATSQSQTGLPVGGGSMTSMLQ